MALDKHLYNGVSKYIPDRNKIRYVGSLDKEYDWVIGDKYTASVKQGTGKSFFKGHTSLKDNVVAPLPVMLKNSLSTKTMSEEESPDVLLLTSVITDEYNVWGDVIFSLVSFRQVRHIIATGKNGSGYDGVSQIKLYLDIEDAMYYKYADFSKIRENLEKSWHFPRPGDEEYYISRLDSVRDSMFRLKK
jgi:hypothetical protein